MLEFVRILQNGGYLCLFDHDAFTYGDYMLCDIEHGFFMNVYNTKSKSKSKSKGKGKNTENQLGFVKYRNWMETDYLFYKYGFELVEYDMYSPHIESETTPTRSFFAIYKLKK
jgi:hypothetical protein